MGTHEVRARRSGSPAQSTCAWAHPFGRGLVFVMQELIDTLEARHRLPAPHECRTLRLRAGASQAEVAAEVGVSKQAVGRWESGTTQPTSRHIGPYLACLDAFRKLVGE